MTHYAAVAHDIDGWLTLPGQPCPDSVNNAIVGHHRRFNLGKVRVPIMTVGGKPARWQVQVIAGPWLRMEPSFQGCYVAIEGNGLQALVNPDLHGNAERIITYNVVANHAERAVAQLNGLADFMISFYGNRIKEQDNGLWHGKRLMFTSFAANTWTGDVPVLYMGEPDTVPVHTLEELGLKPEEIPSPHHMAQVAEWYMEHVIQAPELQLTEHDNAIDVVLKPRHGRTANKMSMLMQLADEIGLPTEHLGPFIGLGQTCEIQGIQHSDALDVVLNPLEGEHSNKGQALRELAKDVGIPAQNYRCAWELAKLTNPNVSEAEYRDYKRQALGPEGGRVLVGVAGGNGENDIPMLEAFTTSLTYADCPPSVVAAATHRLGTPGMGLEQKTLIAMEEVARHIEIFLRPRKQVAMSRGLF